MKTITIYPIIRMEIEVPDNYEGTIENEMDLCADFNATTFGIKGCKLGECELQGWADADDLY